MGSTAYPRDLSEAVYGKLKSGSPYPFSGEALMALFDAMFVASLATDEGRRISCAVAVMDPAGPDPVPPRQPGVQDWSAIRFARKIQLTPSALRRLATIATGRNSFLAVTAHDPRNVDIWGLVDQAIHPWRSMTRERETGYRMPGALQAFVTGPGSIEVWIDYEFVARLSKGKLTTKSTKPLGAGPVRERLDRYIKGFLARARARINWGAVDRWLRPTTERPDWLDDWASNLWLSTLSRILLRVQSARHGGALLMTHEPAREPVPGYELTYGRIEDALIGLVSATVHSWAARQFNYSVLDRPDAAVPEDVYRDERFYDAEAINRSEELEGAIEMVASLTAVDGAVVASGGLYVTGFGAEIVSGLDVSEVALSSDDLGTPAQRRTLDAGELGTRHRSMLRYCVANPDAVGFVVSQDGDVRIIATVDGDLVMWPDVDLMLELVPVPGDPKLREPR